MVSVEDYEEQLAKAGEFHGEMEPSLQCMVWN